MLTSIQPTWTPSSLGEEIANNNPQLKSLSESRRIFLENLQNTPHRNERHKRKISFKIKPPAPSTAPTTLRASKVQQLTNKFNELILEQPEIVKVIKKPSLRPKPSRAALRRRISVKKLAENVQPIHSCSNVRATIAIFEQRSRSIVDKPEVPVKKITKPRTQQTKSLYDTVKVTKTTSSVQLLKTVTAEEKLSLPENIQPNNSFLWRNRNIYATVDYENRNENIYEDTGQAKNIENIYDIVDLVDKKADSISVHSYESFENENDYEYPKNLEDIYETLSIKTVQENNYSTLENSSKNDIYTVVKDPYEIINNSEENSLNYERFLSPNIGKSDDLSSCGSLLSCDQQSNSLYGRIGNGSDNSSSGRSGSDEWVDVSEGEEEVSEFVIVRERQKNKKNAGWSNKVRDQWTKCPKTVVVLEDDALSDSCHYYESLHSDDDFDSFDSESDDESFTKINPNDSGVEMGLSQLPDPPRDENSTGNIYGFTRLAERLRKNWSLTKNDITKSLSRMTKKRSVPGSRDRAAPLRPVSSSVIETVIDSKPYQNVEIDKHSTNTNSMGRKKNWLNFRRAVSMGEASPEDIRPQSPSHAKSTFYLSNEPQPDIPEKPAIPPRKRASRPVSPPPPAPNQPKKEKEKLRSTSWYAECGLFKTTEGHIENPSQTCWYAEVGLYQQKKIAKDYMNLKPMHNEKMQTLLRDEPLYQFYDATVRENAFNESSTSSDSEYDGYEEIGGETTVQTNEETEKKQPTSVRTRLQNCRTLWCEIPEVIQSEILRTLTSTQRKLQEAKFEIITSEASYLNSLTVLTDHFISQLNKNELMSEENRKILFDNVFPVRKCSEKLLNDLELCWQESILLPGICKIIQNYCEQHFTVYVNYCANQSLSDSVLRKCKGEINKAGKNSVGEILKRLETSPACQGLSLHSFLMLPMQRVTRLPLLMDAVFRRLTPSDEEYHDCQTALQSLHSLATRCNEAARRTERRIELQRFVAQLEYPPGIPPVDFGISDHENMDQEVKRYLVRSGELTQLIGRGGKASDEGNQTMKMTFGKRFQKEKIWLMVFRDWVIVAKKKTEDSYIVHHHCPRNFVEVSPPETSLSSESFLLFVTLLENHEKRQISLLLSCSSESERARWIEALKPSSHALDSNETIYESWDQPQVLALHPYTAAQPDELSLQRGDVINVYKKMKDGWFHGDKLADGSSGWFPGNHTQEIVNPHVRARNLRQRYRLLAFTNEFLSGNSYK